jgi:hypothetical protein
MVEPHGESMLMKSIGSSGLVPMSYLAKKGGGCEPATFVERIELASEAKATIKRLKAFGVKCEI